MTPYSCGSHGNTTEGGGRGGEGRGGGQGGGGGGGERVEYELYSVVVHSGSTHSGHYTAYIRDIDLGSWTHPVSDVMMTSFYSSGIHIIHTHPTGTFLTTRCKTNNLVCRS